MYAGSGMRANQCLSIRLSNDGSDQRSWISPYRRTVYLRKQIKKLKEAPLKNATAKDDKRRDIDLHPELASYIKRFVGKRDSGSVLSH
jgi:hypothetical protein